MAALAGSIGGVILWAVASWVLRKCFGFYGWGISDVLMRIPGMKYVTGTPHWTPQPRGAQRHADVEEVSKFERGHVGGQYAGGDVMNKA